jgi:hypothetical protein
VANPRLQILFAVRRHYIHDQPVKVNGRNSIDTSAVFIGANDRVYCNFNIRGAYESLYKKSAAGRYSWDCSFVKTDDKAKADGMYNYLVIQLRNYVIKNASFVKTESFLPDSKTYALRTKEIADIGLQDLNISVHLKKEFDKDEKKDLWKVDMEVRI